MCGICGIYDKKSPSDLTLSIGKRSLQTLHHRGPDDEGFYHKGNIFLGHKRLSIIDVSANGRQPMASNNGRYITVFNGELYNYVPLRDALISKGYTFNGHSDSEVIPNLFQEYGIKFLDLIKGIFAIALYDTKEDKLYLFRDRLGVKPLYYRAEEGYLSFGSELKAILADERIKRIVDHQAIYDYLSLCYVPEPATGFKNIYSLLPGHYLMYNGNNGTVEVTKYYSPLTVVKDNKTSYAEAKKELKDILANSVKLQLMSDVSIGTFLSGGIDSSLVTAFSAQQSEKQIQSFTVKFADKQYDESYYAKLMADHCGAAYNELYIKEQAIDASTLEGILSHFDQPFGDSSSVPTYLISSLIREKITVALSGDGGDEFFSGYELSWRFPFVLRLKRIPVVLRRLAIMLLYPLKFASAVRYRQYKKLLMLTFLDDHVIFQNLYSYLNEDNKHELYKREFPGENDIKPTHRLFKEVYDSKSADKSLLAYQVRYSLPGDMLKKVDMMSMKASIEVRVPLLYEDVIEFACTLPKKWRYKFGKGKLILRDVLATMAPDEVVNKKKWGFGIPLDKSVSADTMNFIRDTLKDANASIYNFINKEVVFDWVDAFFNDSNNQLKLSRIGLYQRIFMLMSLELWLKKYNPALN